MVMLTMTPFPRSSERPSEQLRAGSLLRLIFTKTRSRQSYHHHNIRHHSPPQPPSPHDSFSTSCLCGSMQGAYAGSMQAYAGCLCGPMRAHRRGLASKGQNTFFIRIRVAELGILLHGDLGEVTPDRSVFSEGVYDLSGSPSIVH